MPLDILSRRLAAGEPLVAAWSGMAEPAVVEAMLRQGFDTVVLDMQHGAHDVASALAGIGAAALAGRPAIVRIPVGAFDLASRMLDAGAAAIIAPMVNSVADARALVRAVKYPPLGERSWGPHRALTLSGLAPKQYLAEANRLHLAIPMIETGAAIGALDAILAEPGIDGVFVGPSDLSIALSGGELDPGSPAVERALDHVAARARAAGKIAGLFCFDGARAKAMRARGFGLCSVSTDALLLSGAAKQAVDDAR